MLLSLKLFVLSYVLPLGQVMFSEANYVDWAAHLGGLVSGTATSIIIFVGEVCIIFGVLLRKYDLTRARCCSMTVTFARYNPPPERRSLLHVSSLGLSCAGNSSDLIFYCTGGFLYRKSRLFLLVH